MMMMMIMPECRTLNVIECRGLPLINNIETIHIQSPKISLHHTQNRHSFISKTLGTGLQVGRNYHSQIPFLFCCRQCQSIAPSSFM